MKDKKGFTLIELIAVVVILSILAIIATPNIVNMIDRGKKEQYVADAKDFIAKATYMYKQAKYQTRFESGKIKLGDIEGINDSDLTDPYGYKYDTKNSTIKFEEPGSTDTEGVQERKVTITLYSYEDDKCYMIENIEKNKLSKSDVQLGNYSTNGICSK